MPDSGRTGKSEESGTREASLVIVAESDQSPSFLRCPTCPGPKRTPTVHVGCTSVDATQGSGKDTKLNASPSPPQPGQHVRGQLSLQHCTYPHCKQLSLEGSETLVDGAPDQGIAEEVFAGPSTPVLTKVKRKAEAEFTEDGPVSPLKKIQKPDISEAIDKAAKDKAASEQYWRNRVETILREPEEQLGTSVGRGRCTQIQLANLHVAGDPMDDELQSSTLPFLTLFLPSFGFSTANYEGGRMLTSITDELYGNDPEGVGLEGLNILLEFPMQTNQPSSMDDDQLDQQL